MRTRLLVIIATVAMVLSPATSVAEPSVQVKSKVSEQEVATNLETVLDSKVGMTKDEIAANEIEANLKMIEEQRVAAEAAKAQALVKKPVVRKTVVRVVSNTDNADAIAYGQMRNAQVFGDAHWSALYQLWSRESGWRDTALNARTGACGIPQFINGCVLGDHVSQIDRGMVYIKNRYGTPTNAWNFFLTHNWY